MNLLIIAPLRYVATMNFVHAIVRYLSSNGFSVEILVSEKIDPDFVAGNANTSVSFFSDNAQSVFRGFYFGLFRELIRRRKDKYDCVFGLSQIGVISAEFYARISSNKQFVYLNDELWTSSVRTGILGRPYDVLVKKLEVLANKKVGFTVTQDKFRGKLLQISNGLTEDSMVYLANSPLGKPEFLGSRHLHQILGLDDSKKIILWSGSVNDELIDILNESRTWPDEFVLVIHLPKSSNSNVIPERYRDGRAKIYEWSTADPSALQPLYGSAFIGLALYPDDSENTRNIYYSSGKLNLFMFCGVPCIVSALAGLRWAKEIGGCEMKSTDQTYLDVILAMGADIGMRRQKAMAAYAELLDPSAPLTEIGSRVRALVCD